MDNYNGTKNKAKVEITQLWLYPYIQVVGNDFPRLLPIFFVPQMVDKRRKKRKAKETYGND